MDDIDKLKFQMDIENIKLHVRNSMNGSHIMRWYNHSGYEVFECSSCKARSKDPYGEDLEEDLSLHDEGCKYVSKVESGSLLWDWAKE